MPTMVTHAVAAAALATALTRSRGQPPLFWILCAGLAVLPDVDVVAFALQVPDDSMWAHRGLSHSLPIAAAVGALVAALTRHRLPMRAPALWLCLTVAMASHGVLDAFTNGGSGVAFLAPFDSTRSFAPWRPVIVSPVGLGFFSPWGIRTLVSELTWIWLPLLLLTLAVRYAARATKGGRSMRRGLLALAGLFALFACTRALLDGAAAARDEVVAPTFQVDPFWPKPLPNRWLLGQVAGVALDAKDHVWIVQCSARAPSPRTSAAPP